VVVDNENKVALAKAKDRINSLNSFSTRNSIIKIFKGDNYRGNVVWNLNKNLFIFEDAVYDLSKDEFVTPDPNDYMNISCGKKYNTGIDDAFIELARAEIVDFLKSIVNPCDYEFFCKQLASFLKQENTEEKGYFWLGRGRNGKGTCTDVLRNGIGFYWGELNMEYYTNHSKDVDRPNQNLFNCRNARVLNSSEVNDTDEYNRPVKFISANFKKLTGQDPIYARELGTKRTTNFIAGKTLIQTNKMPEFSKIDTSLRERIVVQEFPFTFTDDKALLASDPTKYKLKDITLKEKLKKEEYRIAFTNLLFEFYKEYKKEYIIPPSVKAFTNQYFSDHCITSFVSEQYEPCEGEKIEFGTFKRDYKESTDKTMSNKQLKIELEEHGYVVKTIKGYFYLMNQKQREGQEDEEVEEFIEDNSTVGY
jgi:phage/plasmid-associated DNA primase